MADEGDKDAGKAKSGPSVLVWLSALVVLGLVAAGAGGGMGIAIYGMAKKSAMAQAESAPAPEKVEKYASGERIYTLPSVVTNLKTPRDIWVRLEGSVIFTGTGEGSREELVQKIGGDIMAHLRTLKLSQLDGGPGLLHLREDLNERVRLRTGGQAREIVIHSLVIE